MSAVIATAGGGVALALTTLVCNLIANFEHFALIPALRASLALPLAVLVPLVSPWLSETTLNQLGSTLSNLHANVNIDTVFESVLTWDTSSLRNVQFFHSALPSSVATSVALVSIGVVAHFLANWNLRLRLLVLVPVLALLLPVSERLLSGQEGYLQQHKHSLTSVLSPAFAQLHAFSLWRFFRGEWKRTVLQVSRVIMTLVVALTMLHILSESADLLAVPKTVSKSLVWRNVWAWRYGCEPTQAAAVIIALKAFLVSITVHLVERIDKVLSRLLDN
ncbi:MAG: hypothetical protein MHM6MM_006728 [Cercozoa sp. M6MM]